MKIQFGCFFSSSPPQFLHFRPLKVISDLWVSFPERMIAVFYGGGERSLVPHQGWCPLENHWSWVWRGGGGADRSTAVPLQIQAVALHHKREDDSLYLPSLPLSLSTPSIIHSFSSCLAGTVSFSQFLQREHTHTHTHTQKQTHTCYISF